MVCQTTTAVVFGMYETLRIYTVRCLTLSAYKFYQNLDPVMEQMVVFVSVCRAVVTIMWNSMSS